MTRIRRQYRSILLLVVLVMTGCHSPAAPGGFHELSMPALTASGMQDQISSGLPVVTLRLGHGKLTAEVAATPIQTASGLSFRTSLAVDNAMLFTYPAPHKVVFHMRDTYIPLSLAFIDSMGGILEIRDMEPGANTPVSSLSNAVRFALEVNRGWFEKHGVTPGTRVFLEP